MRPRAHFNAGEFHETPNDPCQRQESAGAVNWLNMKVGAPDGPAKRVASIQSPFGSGYDGALSCRAFLVFEDGMTQSGQLTVIDPGGAAPLSVRWRSDGEAAGQQQIARRPFPSSAIHPTIDFVRMMADERAKAHIVEGPALPDTMSPDEAEALALRNCLRNAAARATQQRLPPLRLVERSRLAFHRAWNGLHRPIRMARSGVVCVRARREAEQPLPKGRPLWRTEAAYICVWVSANEGYNGGVAFTDHGRS